MNSTFFYSLLLAILLIFPDVMGQNPMGGGQGKAESFTISRHLQNNRINNTFLEDLNGGIYLTMNNSFYTLMSKTGDEWSRITENNRSMAIDPTNPKIFYAINTSSLVYKSMDGGNNWIQIQNGLPGNENLKKLFISPHNTSEVFLLASNGVFRTTDAGFTWQLFKVCEEPTQFLIHSTIKSNYYILTREGVLFSNDAGSTWINISNSLPKILVKGAGRTSAYKTISVDAITIVNYPVISFLLATTENGLFKSADNGKTWNEINEGFSKKMEIKSIFLADDKIYIGGRDKNEALLYESDIFASKWTRLNINFKDFSGICGIYKTKYNPGIFVLSYTDRIAYIDTNNNLIGLNYGVTLHSKVHAYNSTTSNNPVHYAIVENSNYIDVENYGIWCSHNGGISWEKCQIYKNNASWASSPLRQIFISPYDPLEVWIFDNDYKIVTLDGGVTWSDAGKKYNIGFVSDFGFDPENRNIIYFSIRVNNSYLFRFDKSTLGFTSLCESGGSFIMARDNNKKIITRTSQITNDGGWTWKSYYPQLEQTMKDKIFMNNAAAIPLDYSGNTILLKVVSTDIGSTGPSFIVKSIDNGETWQVSSTFDKSIRKVAVNPANPKNIVVIKEEGPQYSSIDGVSFLETLDEINWRQINKCLVPPNTNTTYQEDYLECYKGITIVNDNTKKVICLFGNDGLIRSFDEGITWTKIGGIK